MVVMFIVIQNQLQQLLKLRKVRPTWLISGLALLNANIALLIWLSYAMGEDKDNRKHRNWHPVTC